MADLAALRGTRTPTVGLGSRAGCEPDRNARGLRHGDGGTAARAAAPDKSYAPVCPGRDHLGVAPVPAARPYSRQLAGLPSTWYPDVRAA